ncbi:NepR family anti-sigma factor [Terrarubrum flagellatum]|uniref:NepR family anti-sigma factor n=1 Tax=Terrirubrum flagellatum TaxID=2895980 RepID=UPI0031456209
MNADENGKPALPPDAQARIGVKLRQMYDNVLQEKVPDRFTALLDQLQALSPGGKPGEPAQIGEAAEAAAGNDELSRSSR